MYLSAMSAEAEKCFNHFKQNFSSTLNTCNTIFLSRWYEHYRNISNIYSSEFNTVRKMEIQEDIRTKVTALEFVSDILVITPSRDSVVSKNGWFSIEEYCKYNNTINIEHPSNKKDTPVITIIDPSLCTIILEDINVRREKGIICILISKNDFAYAMEYIQPNSIMYSSATLYGQELYEKGEFNDRLNVYSYDFHNPSFSLTIASPSYQTSMMKPRLANYLLTLTVVLLVSIMIAFGLTFVVTKPLNKLFLRIGGKTCNFKGDPFRFISEYVDTCSAHNKQLSTEKEHLKSFIFEMKNEVLLGMLTNPNFYFHDEYIRAYIPWIDYKYPYILALLKPKMANEFPDESILGEFSDLAFRFISFPALNNDLCLLFWFDNPSTVKEDGRIIHTKVEQLLENEYYFSLSELLVDIEDIQSNYLALKEDINNQRKNSLNLPGDLQTDFINKLRGGKSEECIKLLNQSKFLYDPDAFVSLLIHVAFEYEIDLTEITTAYYWHRDNHRYSEQWSMITTAACNLCQLINTPHHTSVELAESIRQYIEDNYCDPNLCVKQLADKYSMHRTLISKLLKARLGISFSDYVLDLRMKRALELLKTSDMNITTIAEKVGYANYSTFKRAFIRCQGISPKEYRGYNKT